MLFSHSSWKVSYVHVATSIRWVSYHRWRWLAHSIGHVGNMASKNLRRHRWRNLTTWKKTDSRFYAWGVSFGLHCLSAFSTILEMVAVGTGYMQYNWTSCLLAIYLQHELDTASMCMCGRAGVRVSGLHISSGDFFPPNIFDLLGKFSI